MRDQQQSFAAFVLKGLTTRSSDLGQQWAGHAQLDVAAVIGSHVPSRAGSSDTGDVGQLVRTVLAAATAADSYRHEPLIRIGTTIGAEAHRQSTSLHVMLKELDLLGALLLHGAEKVACEYQIPGTGHEGLVVARRITEAVSQLRLAATVGYTQAMSDELRERYRAIRHDLRNPLGTIKSAVALLTDESVPAEMRESRRVRAMVARNTSSLDQLIGEMLGDTAARLRAFDAPGDVASVPSEQTPTSGGEKRDDVTRARE